MFGIELNYQPYDRAFFFMVLLCSGLVYIWDRRCKEVRELKKQLAHKVN